MRFIDIVLVDLWGCGIFFTFGSSIVRPRDQAPFIAAAGIFFLILAGIFTYLVKVRGPKKEAERDRQYKESMRLKNLQWYKSREAEEKKISSMYGIERLLYLNNKRVEEFDQGIAAMHTLGSAIENSVYQEKESDWAIWGGVADGIAGPGAGIATALDVMQNNARIREENAARREWGRNERLWYENAASRAMANRPSALSISSYDIVAWDSKVLFTYLSLKDGVAQIDKETGAVTVFAKYHDWVLGPRIDGTVKANLYTEDGTYAGFAYLNFSETGTLNARSGNLRGTCAEPKKAEKYTVKFEAFNLWEIANKGEAYKGKQIPNEETDF